MKRIVLGLSGGVDSAVSARLLQEAAYDIHALFLDIGNEGARRDAIDTADSLNVPLKILDIRTELEHHVCKPFTDAYLSGKTPNPCIMCNPTVKFKSLCDYADEIGAEQIATGHYARTENGALYKGMPSNDQSYMLNRIRRDQLERLVLPLGPYEKVQVRALAEEFNIPVAHKADSMEICFIPDKDYIGWISRRAQVPGPGDMVFHGEVIGNHPGIHRYTVGQRIPGLFNERKLYVAGIDAEKNRIILALWEELFFTHVNAVDVNWLIDRPGAPFNGSVRVRHTKWENPECVISPTENGIEIICTDPVRAPAPGQSAVVYDGGRVVCGGYII